MAIANRSLALSDEAHSHWNKILDLGKAGEKVRHAIIEELQWFAADNRRCDALGFKNIEAMFCDPDIIWAVWGVKAEHGTRSFSNFARLLRLQAQVPELPILDKVPQSVPSTGILPVIEKAAAELPAVGDAARPAAVESLQIKIDEIAARSWRDNFAAASEARRAAFNFDPASGVVSLNGRPVLRMHPDAGEYAAVALAALCQPDVSFSVTDGQMTAWLPSGQPISVATIVTPDEVEIAAVRDAVKTRRKAKDQKK